MKNLNREIKFRAWDIEKKRMLQNVSSMLNNSSFLLQQYTGLKDCKGKDIYEGDITKETPNGHISQIEWGESAFRMNPAYESKSLWELAVNNRIKVIGNVCESPEKLERSGENE